MDDDELYLSDGGLDDYAFFDEPLPWTPETDPVNTERVPAMVEGIAEAVMEWIEAHEPRPFIDRLGERLAYERTAVRLYEALIAKLEATGVHWGGPTRAELEEIRGDEQRHVSLVYDAIDQLGGDPTITTPSAEVIAVAALGWLQVLTDPRSTLAQCLGVLLLAENGDTEGWRLLAEMAGALGHQELAMRFGAANDVELDHVARLRSWLETAVLGGLAYLT